MPRKHDVTCPFVTVYPEMTRTGIFHVAINDPLTWQLYWFRGKILIVANHSNRNRSILVEVANYIDNNHQQSITLSAYFCLFLNKSRWKFLFNSKLKCNKTRTFNDAFFHRTIDGFVSRLIFVNSTYWIFPAWSVWLDVDYNLRLFKVYL